MDVNVTQLDSPGELPVRMPSPFAPGPVPIARRALEQLRAELPAEARSALAADGKMFGVLVVKDGERVGFLRAFSGMIGRSWHLPGFVPPAFDQVARDAFWIPGEAELTLLGDRIAELDAQIAALVGEAEHRDERHAARVRLRRERQLLDEDRAARSRGFLARIYETYSLSNARGELRPMR
ncbi:MAG TPA: hypothetical protein VL326_11245, partial [Kofleriaceae bacterium]|nr:hypothetical protein [Kofleriaceae bacterium]